MKTTLLFGIVATTLLAGSVNAWVITDEFNGSTLNTSVWTVGDTAGSYNTGGGASLSGAGYYQIVNSFVEGASNIRASLGNAGPSDSVRVDGIIRTDQFNNGRWSNQVALYFDNKNWVSLRLAYENGGKGVIRQGMAGGGNFWDLDMQGPNWDLQWWFVALGVELTPTKIKFYASAPSTDHGSTTDIDANVTVLPLLEMNRPAGFTGQAYAILGKGFAWANSQDPFLVNNGTTSVTDSTNYITFARLTGVPEPSSLGALALGGAALIRRRSR